MKSSVTLRLASLALAMAMVLTLSTGCSALLPKAAPPTVFYTLGEASMRPAVAVPIPTPGAMTPDFRPTLTVSATQSAPGFDGPRIVFVRKPPRLESFALSEWVEPPARLLAPLIVATLGSSGAYRAVVSAPSVVRAQLRLDTELIRLQQNFGTGPSRVRFTLRATLVDVPSLRVIDWREFDIDQAATSEDAHGGVVAAQAAVGRVLVALGSFCAEATAPYGRCKANHSGSSAPECETPSTSR